MPSEPTLAALPNRGLRYFLATRPGFLSVTLVAVLIGLATAFASGVELNAVTAGATVVVALAAHAGVKVMNDYYDALNGTDALNTDRIFPFTGGSRFIQNGVFSPRETLLYGAALLGLVALAGILLAWASGAGLLIVGALGLAIGWAYSAPPLMLNARGFGELCVWTGFSLVAVGADFAQRGHWAVMPLEVTASYALLVTNILFINQFPDKNADEAAGKRTWVVRLGPRLARWGYPLIAGLAYLWTFAGITRGASR
ncbi:prenyltransferase [Methylotetracoccus oryzae]|uniref:prenyltransferase n=1 Tax=Methylotetracoccus oryzae TaxID=1919059 RepID=UPI0019123D4F|nr:prenyltransferase [Methylotetracoccus oryzae]